MSLPEPFLPPNVDLRNFRYMPLYCERLLNSETWILCEADEKVAALTLWMKSWHEVPAASLPDNDKVLAVLAGYGIAVNAWVAIRDKALRGWIKCADGRLWHPVVADIASAIWHSDRVAQWAKECDRIRKDNKKREDSGLGLLPLPEKPERISVSKTLESGACSAGNGARSGGIPSENDQIPLEFLRNGPSVPAETDMLSDGIPPETHPLSDGIPQPKRKENKRKKNPPLPPLSGRPTESGGIPQNPENQDQEFEEIYRLFPRKVDPGHARKAFKAARKKADRPTIEAGVRRFADECRGEPERFIAHPASWLNGERWRDEPRAQSPPPCAIGSHESDEIVIRARLTAFVRAKRWQGDWGYPPDDPRFEHREMLELVEREDASHRRVG